MDVVTYCLRVVEPTVVQAKNLSSLLMSLEEPQASPGFAEQGRTGMCGHPGGALQTHGDRYTTLACSAQPWQSLATCLGLAAAGPTAGGILGELSVCF